MDTIPEKLSPANLAKVAREIAQDILPIDVILQANRLDNDTWDRIQKTPQFQSMLADFIRDWNTASNTKQRVRVKAATAVEMLLEVMAGEVMDGSIPLTQRNEAFKTMCRLGELDGANKELGGGMAGSGVSITINIGAEQPPVTIDAIANRVEEAA